MHKELNQKTGIIKTSKENVFENGCRRFIRWVCGSHITKIDTGDIDLLILYKQADPPENNSVTVHFLRVCVRYLLPV